MVIFIAFYTVGLMELTELNISGSIAQKNSFIITDFILFFLKTESERRGHYYSLLSSLEKKKKKDLSYQEANKAEGVL